MSSRAIDQDRWLSEADVALAEAERLTGLLALHHSRSDLSLAAVQAEIIGLRREVTRIQRDRAGERRREFHPEWMEYSVWHAPIR